MGKKLDEAENFKRQKTGMPKVSKYNTNQRWNVKRPVLRVIKFGNKNLEHWNLY